MLIFLHQKYEIELRNLFRIFEKNRNRKRSNSKKIVDAKFRVSEECISVNPAQNCGGSRINVPGGG